MKSKKVILLPKQKRTLEKVGQNLKLARLRRKLSTEQVAERAGISRRTLYDIERGDPKVTLGNYSQVLFVLGLGEDLLKVAQDDVLGRKLQDADLDVKERAPKK